LHGGFEMKQDLVDLMAHCWKLSWDRGYSDMEQFTEANRLLNKYYEFQQRIKNYEEAISNRA
jgi:hypothetical protein